jgi:hypothetical protein
MRLPSNVLLDLLTITDQNLDLLGTFKKIIARFLARMSAPKPTAGMIGKGIQPREPNPGPENWRKSGSGTLVSWPLIRKSNRIDDQMDAGRCQQHLADGAAPGPLGAKAKAARTRSK